LEARDWTELASALTGHKIPTMASLPRLENVVALTRPFRM
jgi:hypothetical protein